MDYQKRWQTIKGLGEGGQGKVYQVLDDSKFKTDTVILPKISQLFSDSGERDPKSIKKYFPNIRSLLSTLNSMEDPNNHGALKVLHEPKEARDPKRAEARIKNEVQAMSELKHTNLLKILDHDQDGKWFVSEFHPKGSLDKNKNLFTGDFVSALKAFRPLVEGVSNIYEKGLVHRDIKPANVFLDSNNQLVLGDFGLIFFIGAEHTRLSGTWENVGSHAWMPPWAAYKRIEEVNPSFDVFTLGKLLWAMISDIPVLPYWYFDHDEYNLEKKFPHVPYIYMANLLFEKCIVEHESDCIPNATKLLAEIDKILSVIDAKADLIDQKIERVCKVCGVGKYILYIDTDSTQEKIREFGISSYAGDKFKIFTCNHCGHLQLFSLVRDLSFDWTKLSNWKNHGGNPEIAEEDGIKVLKIHFTEKEPGIPSNCSVIHTLDNIHTGRTVQARVKFKCDSGKYGMIFIGDAIGPDPYDNCQYETKQGDGDWQEIIAEVKYTHDDYCSIFLYGNRNDGRVNDFVLYKDLELSVIVPV